MFGPTPLRRTLEAARRDLRHRHEHVRLSAVEDLALSAGTTAVEQASRLLVGVLQQERSAVVRARAASALADLGAHGCVDELCAAASDPDPKVQQMALLALGELAPRGHPSAQRVLDGPLRAGAPALRFQALIAATRLREDRGRVAVVAAMGDEDEELRELAFRLAEEDDRSSDEPTASVALSRAREALDDPSLTVALAAALFLLSRHDECGRSRIVAAIGRRGRRLRVEDRADAIRSAGERGWQEAVEALTGLARGWLGLRSDGLAWHARVALARLGDPWACQSIERDLRSWNRDTRTLAVAAAGQARLTRSRSTLLSMRGDDTRADPDAVREALRLIEEA